MAEIPVEFDYEGKRYKGHLTEVFGAASKVWHLMIDNYYWGQLVHSEIYGWAFHNNQGKMKDLADYFGEIVVMWYE